MSRAITVTARALTAGLGAAVVATALATTSVAASPRRDSASTVSTVSTVSTTSTTFTASTASMVATASPVTTRSRSAHPQLSTAGGGHVHYALVKPLCPAPSNVHVDRCLALQKVNVSKATKGAVAYVQPSAATSGPAGGYTPADLASAYGINPGAATTQTVAIVDAYDDPYAMRELNAFNAHYGLPAETATSFRKVNQKGAAAPLPTADPGWAGEIALDIETVRGVCHLCKILLVEGTTPTNNNLATAVNTAVRLGAKVISNSYGGPEAGSTASVQAAYNHPGVLITASTGDHGWYDWDFANDFGGASANMPNTPASYPSVVAVGGTTLLLNHDGSRQQEGVWNRDGTDDANGLDPLGWEGNWGASGGGCSLRFTAPAWQSAAAGYSALGCAGKRMTGDVAALADPYTGFDVNSHYNGDWVTIGGTSLAAPIIAAISALGGGPHGVNYPAKTLYQNLQYRPASLFDVVNGGNGFCAGDTSSNCSSVLAGKTSPPTGNPNNLDNGNLQYANGWAGLLDCGYAYDGGSGVQSNNTQCNAAPGFDGPSGVGTPNGVALFRPTNPTASITSPAIPRLRSSATFTGHATEPLSGATITGYAWTWGDGTSTASSSATATHAYSVRGTYPVRLTVTDNRGQTGSSTTSVTLGRPLLLKIAGPSHTYVGHNTRFSDHGSSDPNTGGTLSHVAWYWGDHTANSTGAGAWHKFARRGTYRVTLRIQDNTGVVATKTTLVTVT